MFVHCVGGGVMIKDKCLTNWIKGLFKKKVKVKKLLASYSEFIDRKERYEQEYKRGFTEIETAETFLFPVTQQLHSLTFKGRKEYETVIIGYQEVDPFVDGGIV